MNDEISLEEQEIAQALHGGHYTPVDDFDSELKLLKKAAKNYKAKSKRLNIRVTEHDFIKLQSRAMEEGIPFQTLAASVLHKYVTKKG